MNNEYEDEDLLLQGLLKHTLLSPFRRLLSTGRHVLQIEQHSRKSNIVEKQTHPIHSDNISQLSNLKELKDALSTVSHPLRHLSTQLVFSSDPEFETDHTGQIMVIGEAPGEDEDKQGVPFVGVSGQLLEEALNAINLKRNRDYYVINIVPFRPPANRTPDKAEVEFFMPFVRKHVELIKPKLILLVGSTAYKAFLQDSLPISKVRGTFFDLYNNIKALVIFHPSYLLRVSSAKQVMWHDLIKLRMHLDGVK